jgi:hypothetical protein
MKQKFVFLWHLGSVAFAFMVFVFLLVTRKTEDSFLMALIELWNVFFGCIFCGVVAFPLKL